MEKIKKAVSAAEEDQVSRKLLVWLNTYPELPVDLIRFEFLPADTSAMAMSTIQAAYIVRKYITGGYVADYQFKIIYRVKPGNSNDKRLKADCGCADPGRPGQTPAGGRRERRMNHGSSHQNPL